MELIDQKVEYHGGFLSPKKSDYLRAINSELIKALEAWHFYVCASDIELAEMGITRADALAEAYKNHDNAIAKAKGELNGR